MLPGQLLPADVPSAAPMPIDIKYNNGYRTSRNKTKLEKNYIKKRSDDSEGAEDGIGQRVGKGRGKGATKKEQKTKPWHIPSMCRAVLDSP